MIRTYLYIILIGLVMVGCNNPDAGKKTEQNSENPGQDISETPDNNSNTAEALAEEIRKLDKKDFRKAGWGMPKDTVKLTEADDPASEEDSAIIYKCKIAGMNALLGYVFVDDKLIKGKYMFNQPHVDPNKYITDYNDLKKALEKKFGKAKKERQIWANDLYTKFPAEWGKAVELGYLTYLSAWNTKNTEITLVLKGGNKIDLWLEYKSKRLANLEKKIK